MKTNTHHSTLRMLCALALCLVLPVAVESATAQPLQQKVQTPLPIVDVYKSPQCGCCTAWADHLRNNGFKVVLHDVDDVPAARKKLGMPERFGACHTAKVGNYLVEGHVPASDIKRLLKKYPRAIGLAVPSMPPASPGMESDRSPMTPCWFQPMAQQQFLTTTSLTRRALPSGSNKHSAQDWFYNKSMRRNIK